MIKTIKNSLWMKTFLSLTILLFAVTFLLYGIVTAVMPASYRSQQTLGYTEQMGRLVTELENGTVDDAINHILGQGGTSFRGADRGIFSNIVYIITEAGGKRKGGVTSSRPYRIF